MKWTKENCKIEALKYSSKKEFRENSSGAYQMAYINKWFDEICTHMFFKQKPKDFWTKEKCKIEALKYSSKKEFHKNSANIYQKSFREDWLDEICSHMVYIGNRYKRCIYVYEFTDKSVYIGLTYNLKERNINHLKKENSQVYKHMNKMNSKPILKQLTDYVGAAIASKLEGKFVEQYKKDGWDILNKIKTGNLGGGSKLNYTKKICLEESLKYKTRNEFKTKNSSIYRFSLRNGILDEICSHMKNIKKGYWNDKNNCLIEAKKYNKISEFKLKSSGAFDSCVRNGWLQEVWAMREIITVS